jgi:hypothetical protein
VIEQIKKRDGRIVEFDSSKITAAIAKAGQATNEFEERDAKKLTLRVLTLAHELRLGASPEVEEIQDIVERVLLDSPYYKTAKAYIIYREQHAQIRKHRHRGPGGPGGTLHPQAGLEDQREQQHVLFPPGTQQLHLLRRHVGVLAEPNLSAGDPAGPCRGRPAHP